MLCHHAKRSGDTSGTVLEVARRSSDNDRFTQIHPREKIDGRDAPMDAPAERFPACAPSTPFC